MNPLYEYLVTVNYHFIGVVIAGIMIGTLFVFGILYYLYIEKTHLIAYASLYFLTVFLGLFSSSFIILSKIGEFQVISQQELLLLDFLFDYLAIYSVFLATTFIFNKPSYKLRVLFLVMVPLFIFVSYQFSFQWFAFFVYLYLLMGFNIYTTTLSMKNNRILNNLPIMTIYVAFIIYFTLSYSLVIDTVPFNAIEWIISVILVICIISYFMYRYKHILIEKDALYERLTHDFLTGIYSKSYFIDMLDKTEKGIILFIDINQFKWINDELGHYKGDEVLKSFSTKLTNLSNDNILACRFGGDEFALLLTNLNIEESQFLSIAIMNAFKDTLKEVNLDDVHDVGISVGISTFTNYNSHLALTSSDLAMYESKSQGNYKLSIHLEERSGLL